MGTAATALAGIYGALKVQGLSPANLTDLKFVVCGAGSAAAGVLLTLRNAMCRRHGLSDDEAGAKFFILDENGLITKARKNLLELEENFYSLTTFAEDDTSMEGMPLLEVVKKVKPSVLIGLSGCGGIFTDEVLTEMSNGCQDKPPIIFPLSNPTSKAECTAEQAQRCANGRAIFASGSPFQDVTLDGVEIASSQCNNSSQFPHYKGGSVVASSQCNNRFIFPGLALGAALA